MFFEPNDGVVETAVWGIGDYSLSTRLTSAQSSFAISAGDIAASDSLVR